ncbi:hypothetical protein D3C76_1043950 [compost metagenome]
MLADLVELVLQQRLLSQYGVFDNQLKQTGDVESIQIVRLGCGDQGVQQVAFTLFITDWPMRVQLGFTYFYRQLTAFCQQGQQFQIQCADALAQHE